MKDKFKNLLVTGGAGFIGSNFINYILNKYDSINIHNIDNLTYAGNLDNTKSFVNNPRYKFHKGDICDSEFLKKIFKDYMIDGVINFAAESHVDNSISSPEIFIKTNILGVYNLLNISYNSWMDGPFKKKKYFMHSRFHQISTDEVYGSIENGSFSEQSTYNPSSPYSSSKASADMIVKSFFVTYGLNTTISVSSNNFGPNQHSEKLLPKSIISIVKKKPVIIYGDGLNIRDWIFVEDNCKAIDIIFNKGNSGESYNIASKVELTNNDLINKIKNIISEYTDINFEIKYIKDRPGHDRRYSLNISKMRDEFGWIPSQNFEHFLRSYIINKLEKLRNE